MLYNYTRVCIYTRAVKTGHVVSASSHVFVLLAVPPSLHRVEAPLGVADHGPLGGGGGVVEGRERLGSVRRLKLLNLHDRSSRVAPVRSKALAAKLYVLP